MQIVDVVPSGLAEFLRGGLEKTGQDLVMRKLGKLLDDHYVLLRHLTLPEASESMGMVLVGPTGVWQFELLHLASLVKNGNYWVHWDQVQGAVQLVPLGEISNAARNRMAELRAFLAPLGLSANQVVMVPTPGISREFSVNGVERMLFVEDIEKFVEEDLPRGAPAEPLNVNHVVDVLTGKVKLTETEAPAAKSKAKGGDWLKQRIPRLGNLTGTQLLFVAVALLANCCLLSILAVVALSTSR
jgi:hypothetical protein